MNVLMQKTTVIALALLVFLSALAVVNIKHMNRSAFIEAQLLIAEQGELRIEWERLQLGLNSFANYGRVEEIAHKEFEMYIPSQDQVINIFIHE